MSEAEKEAIETMHTIIEFGGDNLLCKEHRKQLQIILSLIEKQKKELEELHKERNKLVDPSNLRFSYFDNKSQTQVVIYGFVSKDKIRELANKIHKTLDANGITRAYQIAIDYDFRKLLGEEDDI